MNIRSMLLLLLLSLGAAHAHEGHDHGDAPPPVTGNIAPRFEARSDLFELVGVLRGEELVIYLDRAADNAPVTQARIEIDAEAAAFKGEAAPGVGGEFRLLAPPLARAGKHLLTIAVEAGDEADLLTATFDMAAVVSAAPTSQAPRGTNSLAYGAAGVLLSLALFLAWRLTQGKQA